MSEIILSLAPRYIAAFGQVAISKALAKRNNEEKANDYDIDFYDAADKKFENITLKFDSKEVNFGSVLFTDDTDSKVLAPPPFIAFEQSKTLIETGVNGTDNIVIERWGTKPWSIRMRGLLIDMERHIYPEKKVKELYKLFQYNGVVDCIGKQFIDKKIKSLYFKRVSFQGVEGFQDTIQYTIEARSIRAVGFTLLEPNN